MLKLLVVILLGVSVFAACGVAPEAATPPAESQDPSATPTPTTAVFFSDGFETGNLSQWDDVSGIVVQKQQVLNGTFAAHGANTGKGIFARKQLPEAKNELYYFLRFKVIRQDDNSMYFLRLRTEDNASILGLFASSTGRLGYRNDLTDNATTSAKVVSLGAWHELQVHVRTGSPGLIEVWFDGAQVDTLTRADDFGTIPIKRIQLGDNAPDHSFEMLFDDVAVGASFIE